jgi:hypothetical protein
MAPRSVVSVVDASPELEEEEMMARSFRSKTLRRGRAWSFGCAAAIGLACVVAGAGPAWACDGFGCLGTAIEQGAHDTGIAIERTVGVTGYAIDRGARGIGTAVQDTAQATGRAVSQVGRDTGRVLSGQP